MALRSPTHTFSVLTAHNPRVSGEKARAHFFAQPRQSASKAVRRLILRSECGSTDTSPPSVTSPTAATQLPPLDQTCVVNRPGDDRTGLGSAMMLTNLPPRSPPWSKSHCFSLFVGGFLFYLRPGSFFLLLFIGLSLSLCLSTFGASKSDSNLLHIFTKSGGERPVSSICLPVASFTLNAASKYVWIWHAEVVRRVPRCCSHQQLPHPPIERHQSLTLC